ncbi:MAG: hypothetical protein HYV62_11640 [Candidatus Rokubacteria bacterium]|nr:hypothetical protein [Candidatus Rokubacteria bacterium]
MTRILLIWLHVMAAAVWLGGLLFASHLVVSALARGERAYLALLIRARLIGWAALGLLVVTGLENLRQTGLARPWVMGKVLLVLVLLALLLPRAAAAIEGGGAPEGALDGVRWLDRILVLLGAAAVFLGVGIARGR